MFESVLKSYRTGPPRGREQLLGRRRRWWAGNQWFWIEVLAGAPPGPNMEPPKFLLFFFFCLIIWRLARVVKGDLAESGLSSVFTPQSTSLAKNESLAHLWSHQLRSPVNETNNQDTKKRISALSREQEMYWHPKLMVYLEAGPGPEHVLLETLDESGENIWMLARWRIIQNHCEITIDFGWGTNWASFHFVHKSSACWSRRWAFACGPKQNCREKTQ